MHALVNQLVQIGLSEKEARVYLASLAQGPSTVQDLSLSAQVNRATAYLVVESLKERGLLSTFEQDKKTMFVAESPRTVLTVAEEEVRRADDRRARVTDLLPQLEALLHAHPDRPTVRMYEGEEGLRSCREYLSSVVSERYDTFARLDDSMQRTANVDVEKRWDAARYKKKFRFLYLADPSVILPDLRVPRYAEKEVRFVNHLPFDFGGEIGILDHLTYFASVAPQPVGCVVESEPLSCLFRAQFELAWMQGSRERHAS